MERILRPRPVSGDEDPRVLPRANRIECGNRRACSQALLIDWRTKHYLLSFEARMADAGDNMAVYAGENHFIRKAE